MSDRLFIFKGYFRAGFPFGDTLRYLEWSEDSSIEEAILRAFSVFYYPKILQRLSVPSSKLDEARGQSISYCQNAIVDLDKLENTLLQLPPGRESKLKKRSPGSQYFFEISIDTSEYEMEFLLESLAVLESGAIGKPRKLIGQAVSSLYYPLASIAFAEPLNQIVRAIHISRANFRDLLVDLGAKNVVQKAASILDTDDWNDLTEKIQMPERKTSITNW
jgi:hypothetical protein